MPSALRSPIRITRYRHGGLRIFEHSPATTSTPCGLLEIQIHAMILTPLRQARSISLRLRPSLVPLMISRAVRVSRLHLLPIVRPSLIFDFATYSWTFPDIYTLFTTLSSMFHSYLRLSTRIIRYWFVSLRSWTLRYIYCLYFTLHPSNRSPEFTSQLALEVTASFDFATSIRNLVRCASPLSARLVTPSSVFVTNLQVSLRAR